MEKKHTLTILLVLLSSALLGGCSVSPSAALEDAPLYPISSVVDAQGVLFDARVPDEVTVPLLPARDLTVQVAAYDIDEASVELAATVWGINCYAIGFMTVNELGNGSKAIVEGTVVNREFFSLGSFAYMTVDVAINQVIKGELRQGDTISILHMGGYISVQDVVTAHPTDDVRFAAIPREKWSTTYIYEAAAIGAYPVVGESFLYFLQTDPAHPDLYFALNDEEGTFRSDNAGNYTRENHFDGYASTDDSPIINSFTLESAQKIFGTTK
jgi:hypothetical protein